MLEEESKSIIAGLKKLRHENVEKYVNKPRPKNQAAAESARLEGNKSYQRKEHDANAHVVIWEKYTMSIALAPTGSETLALAYGNRSALLFHLSKFVGCIIDVDRAVGITKSNDLKIKLLCRKAKCFHALDDLPNAEKALEEAKLCIDPNVETDINTFTFFGSTAVQQCAEFFKVLDLIKATQKVLSTKYSKPTGSADKPEISALKIEADDFSNVTDAYNSKFGRHLVATRDIAPGEVVYVEKPYCASIFHFEIAYPYCSHCCAACLTTIPCNFCPVAMYCSEKCKNEAWNQYHDIQCLVFEVKAKKECQSDSFTRCVITECRKAGGIDNLRALLQSIEKRKGNPSEKVIINGKLKVSKFEMWYNLKKNAIVQLTHKDVCSLRIFSTLISVASNTSFFGKKYNESEIKTLSKNKDVVFVGALFLKVESLTAILSRLRKRVDDIIIGRNDFYSIMGNCVFGVSTLSNHNCNPATNATFSETNCLIVYAEKPIKKNDPISIRYVKSYAVMPRQERQLKLKGYKITCDCLACKEDWPCVPAEVDVLVKYKPNGYEKRLFQTRREIDLYKEHEAAITAVYDENCNIHCTEQMIADLARSVEIAMSKFPQPSLITYLLTAALNIVSQTVYSRPYPIPDACE